MNHMAAIFFVLLILAGYTLVFVLGFYVGKISVNHEIIELRLNLLRMQVKSLDVTVTPDGYAYPNKGNYIDDSRSSS